VWADAPGTSLRHTQYDWHWFKALEEMASRQPSIVAGHMAPGSPTDVSVIAYTRDYLLAVEFRRSESRLDLAVVRLLPPPSKCGETLRHTRR
jgi:hypothetical protein